MKKYIMLADKLGEQEYTVNGVRYIVGSCFQTTKITDNPSIADRFKRIVTSDVVPLSVENTDATMESEYVCSTAGKEDN